MQTRSILAAVAAVLLLLIGVFAYGTKLAGDTRAALVERQVPSPATGEDCAVYDTISALDPALSKVPMADARFLSGEAPAKEHATFIRGLDREIDQFLAASSCGRVGDLLDSPPGHWSDWLALVDGRSALSPGSQAIRDQAAIWRLGQSLQGDLSTWRDGAALVERAGKGIIRGLDGATPAAHDTAVTEVDTLAGSAPDLHALLDHKVFADELAAFDDAASGLFSGFTGLGLSQSVNVFHPVYDRYVALRTKPWAEREPELVAWQAEVDGYSHPIYDQLQNEPILAIERDAATHRSTLDALRAAVRMARFHRTYGACPTSLDSLKLPELETAVGDIGLDGCTVVLGDIRISGI